MGTFAELFRAEAGAGGRLRFDRFMQLALYDPQCGYYSRSLTRRDDALRPRPGDVHPRPDDATHPRPQDALHPRRGDELQPGGAHGPHAREHPRVGREPGADFYTAASSPLFGAAIAAACAGLVGGPSKAREYLFVELGVEPGGGILRGLEHPFAGAREIGLGQALELSGACIVFSNEFFDAQPFRRFRRRSGTWREIWVCQDEGAKPERGAEKLAPIARAMPISEATPAGGSGWAEVELPADDADFLPQEAPEGYALDAPTGSRTMAAIIARQPWSGLFVAADYGKSWEELAYGTPTGTARAYRAHRQSNDLLAAPGEQDLTCHVCWDWLRQALEAKGFSEAQVEAQESFLVRHAEAFLAKTASAAGTGVSSAKQSLMQLLHPSLMGRKFQVLHAFRRARAI